MHSEKIIVDANGILRYLLRDHEEFYKKAEELFDSAIDGKVTILLLESVIAEVVYVLSGLYRVHRKEIAEALGSLIKIKAIKLPDKEAVLNTLNIFVSQNLDFVDALLCAYSEKHTIFSFDKGVNRCIEFLKGS